MTRGKVMAMVATPDELGLEADSDLAGMTS